MMTLFHILWGLDTGGKERLLYRLVRGLDATRFRSVVYTLRAKGPFYDTLQAEGYAVRCLNKRAGLDLHAIRALRRAIREQSPDIVHTQDFTAAAAACAAVGFRAHPLLAMTWHGGHLDLSRPKQWLRRMLMQRAAAVTAVSGRPPRHGPDRRGPAATMRVIPPGIDPAPFDVPAPGPALRRDLGIPADGPLVVSVMRLAAPKDPRLLVRAAQHMARRRPDCRFLLVGDGPLREGVHALVNDSGLRHQVFLAGYRPDIPRLLAAADVCVLASKREGLPLAVLEYMAAARPVVATAVGGVPDLVADGVTGLLVPPQDATRLAAAIDVLLDHPRTRTAYGAAGRRRVVQAFHEHDMIAAYEALYEQLSFHRVHPSSES